MDTQEWQKQLRGYAEPLSKITLAMLFGLFIFEVVKDILAPDLTHWQSHSQTIIFGTVLAVVASYFFLRKQSALYQRILEENTDSKKNEEALRRTKEWFRSLLDHGTDLITVIDQSGTILYESSSIERILGYRSIDRLGKNSFDLVHPEDLPRVRNTLAQAFQHLGRVHTVEMRVHGLDGRWHVLEATGKAMLDQHGTPCGVINSRDITERKKSEEELLHLETKFRTLFESSSDAVMLLDKKSFFDCNKATLAIFGCATREEFCSKHPADLSPVEQPCGTSSMMLADQRIATAMETGSLRFEWVHQRADTGKTFPADVLLSAMELDGKPVLQATVRDITARKQIEEKLRLQATALETAANGIIITDHNGAIVWVNLAFTMLTGYSTEEVVGQNPRLLKSGFQDPAFYANLWSTITSGRSWHGEVVNKRKDGTLYTDEMTITPVRDTQGEITHFIAIKRDITERKQLELQAKQASRLAGVGLLIGGIAHEMMNPLFILTGRLQMAREKLAHQEYADLEQDLKKLDESGQRLKSITERFLKIAKPVTPHPELCSIQGLIYEALESLAHDLTQNRIRVETTFASNLPKIRSDPRQLHEVFLHLILNAVQAMANAHSKGTLTVSTAREGDWIVARIQDDGPGVAPEHSARLFEPFFSTDEQGKGTGLGLWIVRSTLMMLKGEIRCESEVGKGSTFTVRLPLDGKTMES